MPLVQVKFGLVWYSYVTSVVEPERLPPYVIAALYRRRWRIEEAFNTVKRETGIIIPLDWFNQWGAVADLGYLAVFCSISRPGGCCS